jgi:hypothetical protein
MDKIYFQQKLNNLQLLFCFYKNYISQSIQRYKMWKQKISGMRIHLCTTAQQTPDQLSWYRIQGGKLRKCGSIPGSVNGLFLSRTPVHSSSNFLFNDNSGLLILQKAAGAWSWTLTLSSIKLKNKGSYMVTLPCAFKTCTGTSLSLYLLLKNDTKHFYSDAQRFTVFHT